MADVITKLRAYFDLFDGNCKCLDDHQDVIEDVIDNRLTISTPKGDIQYPQYMERIRALLDNGTKVNVMTLKVHELGVEYRIQKEIPGYEDPLEFHSVAMAENGKIRRVVPVRLAESYHKLLKRGKDKSNPTVKVTGV